MADKKRSARKIQKKTIFEQPKNRWVDFLRLDESYTSLVLGIIVVIIASVLLVAFVKSKHSSNLQQATSSISTGPTSYLHGVPLTISPTPIETTATSTKPPLLTITTAQLTATPMPTTTAKPTIINQQMKGGGTYTVKSGDNLWSIAQDVYGSGYNWVDIATANHLSNPGDIYAGNILQLPKVAPKIVTQPQITTPTPSVNTNITQLGPPITASTYVVQKGDSLWTISERAYKGNGYEWSNIAKINNLSNPDLIYSGNILRLPR